MELLVPGYGIVSQDTDKRELLLPGGVVLAEDQEPILGGGGRSLFGLRYRAYNRNRYLFHKATDEGNGPPPPADVPDGGSTFAVAPVWDGFRLARARGFYYQGRSDVVPILEPPTKPPHPPHGRPFRRDGNYGFNDGAGFRRNRYIWNSSVEGQVLVAAVGTHAPFFVRVPFRRLARSRYLTHYAQDASVAAPTFVIAWAEEDPVINARRITKDSVV